MPKVFDAAIVGAGIVGLAGVSIEDTALPTR